MCLTGKPCAAGARQRLGTGALEPAMVPFTLGSCLGKEGERERMGDRSIGTEVRGQPWAKGGLGNTKCRKRDFKPTQMGPAFFYLGGHLIIQARNMRVRCLLEPQGEVNSSLS